MGGRCPAGFDTPRRSRLLPLYGTTSARARGGRDKLGFSRVGGRAVGVGDGDVEEAIVHAELGAVVDEVAQAVAAEDGGAGARAHDAIAESERPWCGERGVGGGGEGGAEAGGGPVKGVERVG